MNCGCARAIVFCAALTASSYPRDLAGYGAHVPHARWPGGARIALQFVLNYEEGAESSVLHGDPASETFLSDIVRAQPFAARHMSMESLYDYGARAGVWRLLRLFAARRLPLTIFGVAMALERNAAVVDACLEAGHEIASHGWRWISYQDVPEDVEREHIARAVATITRLTGAPPLGWYTGRDSPNTRRLVVEHGGFVYDADSYADDLPYWTHVETARGRVPHLVVPYTLDTNDMRFVTAQGFNSGDQFYTYLKDAFDVLYAEGDPRGLDAPRMLSIGLHARLAGRPARTAALARFLDYVQAQPDVWVARRIDIARHWQAAHPAAS
jgi:putative urate catabolism protein